MTHRVAYRYALALIAVADERKLTDRIGQDMTLITETLVENSLLRAVLATPVIRPHLLENVFNSIFEKHLTKEVMNLIKLLIHKGRGALLEKVAENYLLILDERMNVMNASITSAKELDEKAKADITTKLAGIMNTKIRPTYKVDPSLRGGFVAKVGDTLIDASIQNQLELLRSKLKAGVTKSLI
jgi:F-type H+-transporting ATPase subunit delta